MHGDQTRSLLIGVTGAFGCFIHPAYGQERENKPSSCVIVEAIDIQTIEFSCNNQLAGTASDAAVSAECSEIPELVSSIDDIATEWLKQSEPNDLTLLSIQLTQLRRDLTSLYQDAGYLNSGADIPDQCLDGGVLKINLIEGRLSETEVSFGSGEEVRTDWRPFRLRPSTISGLIRSGQSEPLQRFDLQRDFQRLINDPSIESVNMRVEPTTEPGRAKLSLQIMESDPVRAELAWSSDRSPSVGGERIYVKSTARNIVGNSDSFEVELGTTEGATEASLSYRMPLFFQRSGVSVYGSYIDAEIVERPISELDVLSETKRYGAAVDFAAIDTLPVGSTDSGEITMFVDMKISAGVERVETETALLGNPFSFSPGAVDGRTNNLVATGSISASLSSDRYYYAGQISIRHGLDSIETDLPTAPPRDFMSLQAQTSFASLLPGKLNHRIEGRARLQLGSSTLYTSERISIGGPSSLRGFRVNQLTADNAVAASLDYKIRLGSVFGESRFMAARQWTVGAFVDVGHAWNTDLPSSGENTLSSVGVTCEIPLTERASADFYFGEKLIGKVGRSQESFQDSGLGFRLRYRFT